MIQVAAESSTVYRPRGAAWDLFYKYDLSQYGEVLFEGKAGGGKTLAISMFVHTMALRYPGMNILMVRKTRDSMSNSCMKTYEEQVLKVDMPEVCRGRDRTQREHYQYPNGTRIVVVGMNDENRIYSTEWDLIWVNEATELSLSQYATLTSRLRPAGKRVSPFSLILCDCNPSFKAHYLNQRFMPAPDSKIKRLRLISRHEDNPVYYDDVTGTWTEDGARYMAILDALPGAIRGRLYLGQWVTEEGLVYNEFEPSLHIIKREDMPPVDYHFMSCDWGYRNAGVLQVWAVDKDERMYLVHETYRSQETPDFWAPEAVKLYAEFRPIAIVCDPAEPGLRQQFNDRLSRFREGRTPRIAIEANNDRQAGMLEVKSALQRERHAKDCKIGCEIQGLHGKPRIFFVDDALRFGRDSRLAETPGRSVCTTDEIQQLVWLKTKDGQEIKEAWDESIPHDGLDATRYGALFNWKRHSTRRRVKNPFPQGSPGYFMWQAKLKVVR